MSTQQERERAVTSAIHSSAMEGLLVSDEFKKDAANYIDGKIDAEELVEITRRRYVRDS